MKFEVWSPLTAQVELILGAETIPMLRDDRGWWSLETAAAPGAEYRFLVDGNGPFPDPRSPWQPAGVHGPSVVLDHSTFRWNDQAFAPKPLSEAVIYELHVGTFTPDGTYAAAGDPSTRRIPPTARPTRSKPSSSTPTTSASPCCSTSFTTTSAPTEITSAPSAPISPTA